MSLVWNWNLVEEFFEKVVPEPERDEVLIIMLAARKKYCSEISRSEEVLDKLIIEDKEIGLRKLRKFLRIEEGDYFDFKTRKQIPLSATAVYIDLYPKSCLKAIVEWNKLTHQWMYQAIVDEKFDLKVFKKLDAKWFSSLAKSSSRKPVRILDIDTKEVKVDIPRPDWITETRGGYHYIYKEPSKETMKHLVTLAQKYNFIETSWHQGLTVIPGTLQGGYKAKGFPL